MRVGLLSAKNVYALSLFLYRFPLIFKCSVLVAIPSLQRFRLLVDYRLRNDFPHFNFYG